MPQPPVHFRKIIQVLETRYLQFIVLIAKYTEDSHPTWQGLHHLF